MAAVGGNIIVRFTYTGEEDIPDDATHVTIVNVRVVRRLAFFRHRNIVEVICHEDVEKIEDNAFYNCPSLRRVIMPGVTIVEDSVFNHCSALEDVECDKLKRIKGWAFDRCISLRNLNLPCAEIVEDNAFYQCTALTDVKFGGKLERFDQKAFMKCRSLERITIPLKGDMITNDDIFMGCTNLNHVDLVEGALHETIAALHFEEWRKDMNQEITSINQILPNIDAGSEWGDYFQGYTVGDKAEAILSWIRSLIRKITRYKAEHLGILNEAATTLQLALPQDVVMNNVLPFLDLPSCTFGEGDESEEEEDDNDDEEMEVNLS